MDNNFHGRGKHGVALGRHLTDAEVIKTRTSLETTSALTKRFDVCIRTVRNVRSGRSYHIAVKTTAKSVARLTIA